MSGSGSSGGSYDSWPRDGQDRDVGGDECDITEETVLNSPNAGVVQRLAIGDVLTIRLQEGTPTRLVAESCPHGIAGTITSTRMPDIAACIRMGFEFKAKVLCVSDGYVRVVVCRQCA